MILTLLDITFNMTWWSCKKLYGMGYYMIYGAPQSNEFMMTDICKRLDKIDKKINY